MRHVQKGRGTVRVEPLRHVQPPPTVVDPLLPPGVTKALDTAAVQLCSKRPGVDDGADVGRDRVVDQPHAAGFDVDLDLRKADGIRHVPTASLEVVLGDAHQAKPGQSCTGILRHVVDVFGNLMAIELAAQGNRPLGRSRERHALRAISAPEHPPVGHIVALGRSTQITGSNFLQLLLGIQTSRPVRARMRMSGHTASLQGAPGQMLTGVAPHDLGLFPVGLERFHRRAGRIER